MSEHLERLREEREYQIAKLTRMKLLNEERTYPWEYETCRERIALLDRLIARRTEIRLLSSGTRSSP